MKTSSLLHRIRKAVLLLIGIVSCTTLSSCAVFNYRYTSWNKSVSRDPNGVLSHAQASTRGNGKPALLLVHGFGDGPHVWNTLGPSMAEKGFTVRSLRLPGWNEPIDVKRHTDTEDWHRHILSEMTELRQTHETVVVLAHSMGGCLTTVLTQSGQLQPDALVLYAPMFGVSSARSPLLKTRTWFEMGKYILPDSMIMESIFPDHARVIEPRPKTQRDPFVPVSFYKMLYAEMDLWESQPARTSCPVRLVLPGEDRVVDSDKANRWFEALEAPVKIRTVLEKTGHVLPLDLDASAESDRLIKWLTEQGITP